MIQGIVVSLISYRSEFEGFGQNILPLFSNGLMMFIAVILLWVFADKVAMAILKGDSECIEHHQADYNKIAIITITLAGLFVLLKAVPDLVRMIIQHSFMLTNHLNYKETSSYIDSLSRIIGELVQVGLGIWLLIGSKGIFKTIKSFRDLGLDRIENIEK
jgi:hypothetical protein